MGAARGLTRLLFGNTPKSERSIEVKLGFGWMLLSVSAGGWRNNIWVGLLVLAVGVLISGVLSAYGEAQKMERKE